MKMRAGILAIVLALVSSPAHAQTLPALLREFAAVVRELSTLRARVAKLESGQVTAADLAGRYAVSSFGVGLAPNPQVLTETGHGIMTLRADFTGDFAGPGQEGACTLTQAGTWSVECDISTISPTPLGTFTWKFEDGNIVGTIVGTTDEEEFSLTVGAGGRALTISNSSSNVMPIHSFSDIWIAIRLPNQ